jgi:hypothetical protein
VQHKDGGYERDRAGRDVFNVAEAGKGNCGLLQGSGYSTNSV